MRPDSAARSQDSLTRVGKDIAQATGRSVKTVRADLGQREDLLKIEGTFAATPSITMLVNNAPASAPSSSLLMSDVEAMERMIQLNVTALTRLVYAVAPSFVAREHGTIVNMASALGLAPEILNGVYGATKAFVMPDFLPAEGTGRKEHSHPGGPSGRGRNTFWEASGGSLDHLPDQIIMKAEDAVDAALAGLDMGELITLPSVPDIADWNAYEAARQKLMPDLSRNIPAPRYRTPALAPQV